MMTDKRGWSPGVYNPQRMYDILIAPYNSTDSAKSQADVILSGSSDEILINEALEPLLDSTATVGVFPGAIKIKSPLKIPSYTPINGLYDNNMPYIEVDQSYLTPFNMINILPGSEGDKGLVLKNIGLFAMDADAWVFNQNVGIINETLSSDTATLNSTNFYGYNPVILKGAGNLYTTNFYVSGPGNVTGTVGVDLTGITAMMYSTSQQMNYLASFETGMKIASSCPYVYINGMYIKSSSLGTPFNVTPSTKFVLNNISTKSGNSFDNKGTSTIAQGANTIAVTHGMAMTPRIQDIEVIPGASCTWWISNITSTQFTINIASAAPSGGISFGWHCKIY